MLLLRFGVFAVASVALGAWTYADASARDSDAAVRWGLAVAAFLPLAGVYVLYRTSIGERFAPPGAREDLFGTVGVGLVLALVVVSKLAPEDPTVFGWTMVGATPLALFVSYLFVASRG